MNQEINFGTKLILYAIAGLVDLCQFLPDLIPVVGFAVGLLLSPLISLFALILFWVWFKTKGISIFKGKNLKYTLGVLLCEFIPGLDGLVPGWVGYVGFILKTNEHAKSKV